MFNRIGFSKFLILILAAGVVTSCKKGTSCSKGSTSAECVTTAGNTVSVSTIPITFVNSYWYDTTSATWKTIPATQPNNGTVTNAVNIYSSFVNMTQSAALTQAVSAKSQYDTSQTSSVSEVPYLELSNQDGVTYIFRYQKKDTSGNIVYQMTGTVPKSGTRHILPIVNETFNNQLYASGAQAGVTYNHKLSFSAQKAGTSATNIQDVVLTTIYQVPNLDFTVADHTAISGLNIANRWNYFYSDTAGTVPNADLKVLSLSQKNRTGESTPLDVRVSFKDIPQATLTETVFTEVPFNLSHFNSTKTSAGFPELLVSRGYQFNEQTINLDTISSYVSGSQTVTAIGLNLYVAGVEVYNAPVTSTAVTKESDRSYVVNAVPALTPFDINYGLNFGKDSAIISPMAPICHEERNQSFNPVTADAAKATAIAAGNFYSYCHPDTYQTETIALTDLTKSKSDVWYGAFNYSPYKALPSKGTSVFQLGTFNGVKKVTISISGCVKIEVRSPGASASSWQTKTSGSSCGASYPNYTYFNYSKSLSIFDLSYPTTDGLSTILSQYGAATPVSTDVYVNKYKVQSGARKLF